MPQSTTTAVQAQDFGNGGNCPDLVRQIGFSQGFHPTATFLGGLGDSSPNVTQHPYSAISYSAPLNPELLRTGQGNRLMIALAQHDTCPFPTPASPRYHISSAWEWAVWKFPGATALPAKIVQNETWKTTAPKTAGSVPRRSWSDKTGQNDDKTRHCPDISGQDPDKNPQTPRSNVRNVRFCPIFSAFPPPQPGIWLRRGPAAARQ